MPFQGNSRSYRPQPSVFKGVQDCHLPAFKPLQAPAICFKGVQDCRLPGLKPLKSFKPSRKPFQGNSRSFPQASKATLAATRPRQCFKRFRTLSKATLSHLFLRAFKTAVCPPSNPSNPPQAFPRQLSQLPAGLSKATLGHKSLCLWFTVSHGLSVLARAIYFSCMVFQPASNPSAGLSKATLAATGPRQCFKPFRKPIHPSIYLSTGPPK